MEFGKTSNIENIDWIIPADDPTNFSRFKAGAKPRLYVGGTAWGTKAWLGKFYPPGTSSDEFLTYYAKSFNCIELNASHYKIPDLKTTNDWLQKVNANFLFCPKVHKDISHNRFGLLDPVLHKMWYEFLQRLGPNCGPSFIQFHEKFDYEEKSFLFKFLEQWPKDFKLTIELRHRSWFENHRILPALTDYLHKKNIGLVITDVAGRRDVLHTSLTSDWSMIRLIGNNLVLSDEQRLKDWGQRLETWFKLGIQDIYLFLHQPDDILTVEFAQLAKSILKSYELPDFPEVNLNKPRDLFNQE